MILGINNHIVGLVHKNHIINEIWNKHMYYTLYNIIKYTSKYNIIYMIYMLYNVYTYIYIKTLYPNPNPIPGIYYIIYTVYVKKLTFDWSHDTSIILVHIVTLATKYMVPTKSNEIGTQKKAPPRNRTADSEISRTATYLLPNYVACIHGTWLVCTNRRLDILTKKQNQNPLPEDDARTAEAAPGRVERDE